EGIAPARWSVIAAILDQGKKPDQDRAREFQRAFSASRSAASDGALATCLDSYLAIFFTTEGTPRVSLVTNDLARAHPKIEAELRAEQLRLDRLRTERRAAATFARTRALTEVASAIFKRYGHEKAARGILHFDDP